VNGERKIIWAPRAIKQFSTAIEYIRKESDQNADLVKEKILAKISYLSSRKTTHRKDVYRKNNDGHFHYFELMNYRISYYAGDDDVIILRIRHVSMKPLYY